MIEARRERQNWELRFDSDSICVNQRLSAVSKEEFRSVAAIATQRRAAEILRATFAFEGVQDVGDVLRLFVARGATASK